MKSLRSLLTFLFSFCVLFVFAQKDFSPGVVLPTDPDVIIGKLDNGLVYYIRKNKKPENRVEMRLAVNAGSILETDGQKGLAHFVEHMCFNGTRNFPKNELINYLQQTGVKFGAGINAYTSFDETVYMLQLPSDKTDLLEKGYLVLEDWAQFVSFDAKEIDKERGIIVEEWRMGLGADDRMRRKYLPMIFKDSKYADRLPIGDVKIIETFKYDTLRRFYRDWYRPELMAVIVVGDIDPAAAEQKIIQHFSGLINPAGSPQRTVYEIPGNQKPIISIASDHEATSTMVNVYYKQNRSIVRTAGDYRNKILRDLYSGMLSSRFREISEKPDAPYIYAYNSYGRFLSRSVDAFTLSAMAKENAALSSLEILLTESKRVSLHGFLPSELERQKADLLNRYEKMAKEHDKTESARHAREYVSHFLNQEPMPGIQYEYEMVKFFLQGISLEEINALSSTMIKENNIVVVVTSPEKAGIKIPTEDEITEIFRKVEKTTPEAYSDLFVDEPLVGEIKAEANITEKREFNDPEFTEITLENGIKIIIKQTDFKNDEILFSAYSPGGNSLYAAEDMMTALLTTQIISQSGLGNFNRSNLEKKLKGKNADLNPYIDELREGFSGRTSPRDLETLLQLTWLYFSAPRYDTAAFISFMSRTKNQMKFIRSNPTYAFLDTLTKTSNGNDPRLVFLPTESQFAAVKHEAAYKMFRERFSDASDFTFFFVGNISPDTAAALITKYLGSLPTHGSKERWKDVTLPLPEGIQDVTLRKGSDPKGMVGIILQNEFDWNADSRLHLRMLKEIISIELVKVIREEMSGVYSPQVQMSLRKYPVPRYSLSIMFGCSPGNQNKLTKAVLKIINDLRTKGPNDEDVLKVRELLLRERETDLKTNKFWLTSLEQLYYYGDNTGMLTASYEESVKSVNKQQLQKAAFTMFPAKRYVRAVLLPEKK